MRVAIPAVLTAILLAFVGSTAHAQVLSQPTIDISFQPYEGARPPIAFQTDGKILVSGVSFLAQGVTQNGIARLNANGTLDTTFMPGSGVNPDSIASIAIQSDQKVLVAGSFTSFSGQTISGLVRLTSNGSLDSGFHYDGPPNVTKVVVTRSGDLLILNGDSAQIRRHAADGTTRHVLPRPIAAIPPSTGTVPRGLPPDYYVTRFAEGDVSLLDAAELSDGTVLGAYSVFDNAGTKAIEGKGAYGVDDRIAVRIFAFAAEGTLKASWPDITALPSFAPYENDGQFSSSARLLTTSSGDFYVFGSSGLLYRQPPLIGRFHPDGSPDTSFIAPQQRPSAAGIYFGIPNGALDSNGRLILSGGLFVHPDYPADRWETTRLLANGVIDPLFGIPGPTAILTTPKPTSLAGVKIGPTPTDDRIFVYDDDGNPLTGDSKHLIVYKSTNTLTLAPEGALSDTLAVTVGKRVSLEAPLNGSSIKWQVSRDNGSTWIDLANDTTYQGVDTSTLTVANAAASLNGERYRYVITTSRGSVASNAASLAVAPLLFPFPAALGLSISGVLYVGDTSLHTIQKIEPSGQVSPFAGSKGQTGTTDGPGPSALFNQPGGLAVTAAGGLVVADTANGTIRSITPSGVVTTLAGSSSNRGGTDGVGSAALFSVPVGIARGPDGAFYVADSTNHTIRKITADGTVSTFAGTAGASGASDGSGTAARFNQPTGIAVDASGRLYVADTANNLIRSISSSGVVTTLAGVTAVAGAQDGSGGGALFNQPSGLAVDANGNVYVADTGNSAIRKIAPSGTVSTLAGLPTIGGLKDGTGPNAWFNQPKALALSGDLYVADTGNAAIRKVTLAGVVTTLALAAEKPVITNQPASLTVTIGGSATFSVNASSALPLTYQWQKTGAAIAGATAATYAISTTTSESAGSYAVVVSNASGAVTSSSATLTVTGAPTPPPSSPTPSSGGGGAPSVWFLSLLSLLALGRRVRCRSCF